MKNWTINFAGVLFLTVAATCSRGDAVSAYIGEENGNFDELNLTTGASTVIAKSDVVYDGLAFNGNETVLYGLVFPAGASSNELVTIDPSTGVDTAVGDTGLIFTTFTSLSNGELFGLDYADNLYQINPTTGAATLIGATGLPVLSPQSEFDNSLSSNGTTLLYTLDTNGSDSSLYSLSLTSGAATDIGPTGTTGIIGSAFAGATFGTGQLYGFNGSGDTYLIDEATGAATFFNTNGLDDIYGGVGFVDVVPEPSAVSMLMFGGLALAGCGFVRSRKFARN